MVSSFFYFAMYLFLGPGSFLLYMTLGNKNIYVGLHNELGLAVILYYLSIRGFMTRD